LNYLDLARFVKEVGISIGVFILCFWMVKFVLERISSNQDRTDTNLNKFMTRVREEHDHHDKLHEQVQEYNSTQHAAIMLQHEKLLEQSRDIVAALKSINDNQGSHHG